MTNQRRLLRKLGRLWEEYPELRLGQLLGNLASKAGYILSTQIVSDKELEGMIDTVLVDGFGTEEEE